MLRLLLLVVLINGLAPALGEALELLVHYAASGHVAHFEAGEDDLGAGSEEHGCGPIAHHCGCCPSQSVMPPPAMQVTWLPRETSAPIPGIEQKMAVGAYRRLLRPPIAA